MKRLLCQTYYLNFRHTCKGSLRLQDTYNSGLNTLTSCGQDRSLSLTPTDADRNKILILSPGSAVSAMDTETKSLISKRLGAKTTKLEDDDIAGLNNSGIIQ